MGDQDQAGWHHVAAAAGAAVGHEQDPKRKCPSTMMADEKLSDARKTTAIQVANESLSNAAAAPTLAEKDYTLPRTANVHRFVVVDICDREAAAQIDDEMQQLSRISGEEDSPEAFAAEAAASGGLRGTVASWSPEKGFGFITPYGQ